MNLSTYVLYLCIGIPGPKRVLNFSPPRLSLTFVYLLKSLVKKEINHCVIISNVLCIDYNMWIHFVFVCPVTCISKTLIKMACERVDCSVSYVFRPVWTLRQCVMFEHRVNGLCMDVFWNSYKNGSVSNKMLLTL